MRIFPERSFTRCHFPASAQGLDLVCSAPFMGLGRSRSKVAANYPEISALVLDPKIWMAWRAKKMRKWPLSARLYTPRARHTQFSNRTQHLCGTAKVRKRKVRPWTEVASSASRVSHWTFLPCASCSCSSPQAPTRACHVASFSAKSGRSKGLWIMVPQQVWFFHGLIQKCLQHYQ